MTEVPLRDAATVMLVRDTPVGERATPGDRNGESRDPGDDSVLEVFMLRRNLQSDFVGGAYVFPGGGVDDHDRHDDLEPICHGSHRRRGLGPARHRPRRPGLLGGRHPRVVRGGRRAAGLPPGTRRPGSSASTRPRSSTASPSTAGPSTPASAGCRDLRRRAPHAGRRHHALLLATGSRPRASTGATTPGSSWPGRPRPRCRCTTTARSSPTCGSAPSTRWPATGPASSR